MGFFSSIKKLFGFGEQETNSSSEEILVSETVQEVQVVEEVIEEPEFVKVETPIEVPNETVTLVEEKIESKPNTVKDIKSRSRSRNQKPSPSSQSDSETPKSQKPKKPYRRPRPKKEKPSE
jgi:hypothetical protein